MAKIIPTGMLSESERIRMMAGLNNVRCANCGIDHESRNFIRAIVLHLLDDFELSNDFIDFLKTKSIINERGYELYQEAHTKSNLYKVHKTREQIEPQNKTDVERLRIIFIKRYNEMTCFLCIDKDAKVLAGEADSSLISDDLGPNSIIEIKSC
jgi:hypothetical protein